MAHILIGRYRALTEAEAIVHDLVEQGFARSQMTLATPYAVAPASAHLGLQVWSALEGTQDLQRRFLDLGIPDNEVSMYTEAVRQGETLVMVHASPEQAERGLDILHEMAPLSGVYAPTYVYVTPIGKHRISPGAALDYREIDGQRYIRAVSPYRANRFLEFSGRDRLPPLHERTPDGFIVSHYLDGNDQPTV